MTRTDFDIFDCHQHMGTTADAAGVIIAGAVQGADIDPAELEVRLRFMDEANIRQAIAIPGHSYNRAAGVAATRAQNDAIAAYRDHRPDRFPIAAGLIEPQDQQAGLEELERITNELDIHAVSFHTEYQGVTLDSPWMMRILARMAQLGVVPLLHAANIIPHEALWRLAKVARAMPDVTILALEPFFTHEGMEEAKFVAEIAPNVLFDLASCAYTEMAIDFIRTFGAERVVYGSQFYSRSTFQPGRRLHGRALDTIDEVVFADGLSKADKALVLGGNLRRIFHIDPR